MTGEDPISEDELLDLYDGQLDMEDDAYFTFVDLPTEQQQQPQQQ